MSQVYKDLERRKTPIMDVPFVDEVEEFNDAMIRCGDSVI